jgi:predicted nucleic acid-binding protein
LTCLLDACALLAFLNEEKGKGYEAVDALFDRAEAGEVTLCMSIVNLAEVYYGYIQDKGQEEADRIMQNAAYLPMTVIDTITEAAYRETARFKAGYSMSLADAFLCGTAKSLGAAIVTKDGEIREPERAESLSVLWIR